MGSLSGNCRSENQDGAFPHVGTLISDDTWHEVDWTADVTSDGGVAINRGLGINLGDHVASSC